MLGHTRFVAKKGEGREMFALANAQERKSFVVAPAPLTQEEGGETAVVRKKRSQGRMQCRRGKAFE